ncbi:hypothetical protein FA15DRAFT_719362 [Coprinopsis marcescibilis]|uniref:Peptidase C14 caspase domain-containing protein n=1 Tax=Coprinopsis marcescibilis TaxID=230819 RepID=A0A5C3KKE0_COPMA|nr:hypothetical protein FA15DRAFT_719362 [Coprinopsis marcescibilis]
MGLTWNKITSYVDLLWQIMNEPSLPASRPSTPRHDESREQKVASQVTLPASSGRPPLFALIIGINNYEHYGLTKLYGAVPDAEAMRKYLVEDLKVPDSQITLLCNRDASRQAVIDGFIKLRDNKNIKKDDPILIYYAGHGAHYTFHLNHTHANNHIQNKISFEFLRVWESETEFDEDGFATITPDTKNLIRGGMLDIVVEKDVMYGIKIKNDTPWNLHFQCLYFDNDDFSITALTDVKTTSRYARDYTLASTGGTAAIGYGSLGIPPITCELPDGVDVAAGFFKFWFSSEPVDLSHVPQTSPFDDLRHIQEKQRTMKPVWGTVLIPVIQRRS